MHDIEFANMTPKVQKRREMTKLDFTKMKNFHPSRNV